MGNRQHFRHVATGVGKAAGAAVLGVGLAHAMPERNLPILPPDHLARADLDADNHIIGMGQERAAVGAGADGHAGVPFGVHAFGQPVHGGEGFSIEITKPQGRAF